jgi:hypothetical protein
LKSTILLHHLEPATIGKLTQPDYFIANENIIVYNFIMSESIWRSRWSKDQLAAILREQYQSFWQRDTGIPRTRLSQVEQAARSPHAVIVSGLRRAGKSTLLAQWAHKIGADRFYYINFEDERFLGFAAEDVDYLFQNLVELFGQRQDFIIDEIQNVPGWEHAVRRLIDLGFKFYLSGSNASLLSRELGSKLSGRYIPVELFPFSFTEYLHFKGIPEPDLEHLTTIQSAALLGQLTNYLKQGGLPEALKYPELPIRRVLYDDILYRDVATRYGIEEVRALKELAFFLISNPAKPISYNKLKETLRLGSVNTVKNYVEYLENSWLFFTLNVYDYSIKRQQIAPKKVFTIDTGLLQEIGFFFSPNTGRLLENLVFLALRRKTADIFYYQSASGHEVDFYLPGQRRLVQVAQQVDQPQVRERELRGLLAAMEALDLSTATILSEANLDPIQVNNRTITIQSLAEWLIKEE